MVSFHQLSIQQRALSAGPTLTERKLVWDLIKHSKSPSTGVCGNRGHWADRVWGGGWGCGLRRSGGQRAPLSLCLNALGVWLGSGRGQGWRPPWKPFPGEVAQPGSPRGAAAGRVEGVPGRAAGRGGPGGARGGDGISLPWLLPVNTVRGGGCWKGLSMESFSLVSQLPEKLCCVFYRRRDLRKRKRM